MGRKQRDRSLVRERQRRERQNMATSDHETPYDTRRSAARGAAGAAVSSTSRRPDGSRSGAPRRAGNARGSNAAPRRRAAVRWRSSNASCTFRSSASARRATVTGRRCFASLPRSWTRAGSTSANCPNLVRRCPLCSLRTAGAARARLGRRPHRGADALPSVPSCTILVVRSRDARDDSWRSCGAPQVAACASNSRQGFEHAGHLCRVRRPGLAVAAWRRRPRRRPGRG